MMNRIKFVPVLLLLLFCRFNSGYAQYSVIFEQGTWQEVLSKAKKNKKLIFLDCYATWCGPCKMLDKNVFTDKVFGDYVNRKYVNYKIDMEKGYGPTLRTKFKVSAYPTLLLVDPTTERAVHRIEGYNAPSVLIAKIEDGIGDNKIENLKEKYRQGTRDTAFLKMYFSKLKDLGMENDLNACVTEYFQQVPDSEFVSQFNWHIIVEYVEYFQTIEFQRFLRRTKDFLPFAAPTSIENKVLQVLFNTARYYALYIPENYGDAPFQKEFYQDFLMKINNMQSPYVPSVLLYMTAYNHIREKQWDDLVNTGNALLTYRIFNPYLYHYPAEIHAWAQTLLNTKQPKYYTIARKWLEQVIEVEQNVTYRKIYLQTLLQVANLSEDNALRESVEKKLSSFSESNN